MVLPLGQELPNKPDYTSEGVPGGWQSQMEAFLVTNDSFAVGGPWRLWEKIELPHPTHVLYAIGYVEYEDAFSNRYRAGYARLYRPESNEQNDKLYPTPESYAGRNNLAFVPQEGYNYDICLDVDHS
jgi:hypothetical protein